MRRFEPNGRGEGFDLVIIGGGITGCAVAYEAAHRGFSVCLLEKGDFGGATSAATSKLIHGGLRYLRNLELGLVRESLRERRILADIAPNLVYPLPHLVPLYGLVRGERAALGLALGLYDLLAWDRRRVRQACKRLPGRRMLGPQKARSLEPGIRPRGLTGAALYYDYQNLCPERLTLAFLKSALAHGARAANYARVEGLPRTDRGRVRGVLVRDLMRGSSYQVEARLVLNCAGPWADGIVRRAGGKRGTHLVRSEGIHLVTRPLVGRHGVVRLDRRQGHFFVLPWRGHSLIGTTDQPFQGDPDQYRVRARSLRRLLERVNAGFGPGDLGPGDVLYAYGGLRPLVESGGGGTYRSSRRYQVLDHAAGGLQGLISVEGGKYTTSRGLALEVVEMAGRKLGRRPGPSRSHRLLLTGCRVPELERFLAQAPRRLAGASPVTARTLARLYGEQDHRVWELARGQPGLERVLNREGEVLAQVVYAVRHEMALTLSDILLRRTGLGTLGHPGRRVLEAVLEVAARELGWDRARREEEMARARAALRVPGREDES